MWTYRARIEILKSVHHMIHIGKQIEQANNVYYVGRFVTSSPGWK
mgnify:CR=1 FL=1